MYVVVEGNLSEGYTIVGPYETWADAADAHTGTGWIMPLKPARSTTAQAVQMVNNGGS